MIDAEFNKLIKQTNPGYTLVALIKKINDLEEKFAILGYEDVKADEKLKVAYIQNLAKIPVICCKVDDGGAMVNEIRMET